MSTTGELIIRIIKSHMKGDTVGFSSAAEELVKEERRKNHHILARDIERLLKNGASSSDLANSLLLLGTKKEDLPKDKERGVFLVEIIDPQKSLDDLILINEVREQLQIIIKENRMSELLHSFGLRPITKVLFCGPPGCGKTVGAEVIAQALYLPLVLVRFDAVVSSYLGETAANLRKVFEFATTKPMVLLFDEFDAIGKHRTDTEDHGELKRVVNSFLQMLDSYRGETLMIAATNHQGLLDSALWRRFDEIVFFNRPGANDIVEVFKKNFRQIPLDPKIILEEYSKNLIGLSHADIERISIQAIKTAVLTEINTITLENFLGSINIQKKRYALTQSITGSLIGNSIIPDRIEEDKPN